MDIPRMFYGRMGEVSARATKLQKEFLRDKPLHELDFGPMMSTSEEPTARIVLRRLRGDLTPNPAETPGRVYELLCAAMQKFKSEAPWPPS